MNHMRILDTNPSLVIQLTNLSFRIMKLIYNVYVATHETLTPLGNLISPLFLKVACLTTLVLSTSVSMITKNSYYTLNTLQSTENKGVFGFVAY